ncbi:hypothetical protein [Nocardioides sp.]|uniref:hypothetical protein n=1 Tax=Nocardioides sp. TaxID=35761 RepID=UPI002CC68E07|nr:hypothetical protein [Nocardioides sp.]HXH79163.1 hypothetical protein [Nocardioides sp.]
MQLRRSLALTTAAVALSTAGLSSCGFNYATNRDAPITSAVNNQDGEIDVLSAVIVSTEAGSGTFVASLSNNSLDEEASMTEVTVLASEAPTPAEFEPVNILPGTLVNLADPATDIKVAGDFAAGDFVEIAIGFDNGETVEMEIEVVENGGDYADLDGPAPVEESHEGEESETEH